jgi:error-prone DNA polymerase
MLCQGRDSAVNSAACFALGIIELDPTRISLLFERFISHERDEPQDIYVDFEHDRRGEVNQYIFRYGYQRAALTAVVSTNHAAGTIRDVSKAPGLPPIRSLPSQTAVAAGRITCQHQSGYVNQVSIQQVSCPTVS